MPRYAHCCIEVHGATGLYDHAGRLTVWSASQSPHTQRNIFVQALAPLGIKHQNVRVITPYIGGGFGKGIHNTLEAATYGLPVIFGPGYQKFSEAVELTRLSAAFPVHNEEELLSTIHQQLKNPELLKTTSEIAGNYVMERVGATSVIMNKVCIKSAANML